MSTTPENLALETEMYSTGVHRYRARIAHAVTKSRQSHLPSVRHLFREVVVDFERHITTWVAQEDSCKPSRLKKLLRDLTPGVVAYRVLEVTFNKLCVEQRASVLAAEIGRSLQTDLLWPNIQDCMSEGEWAALHRRLPKLTQDHILTHFKSVLKAHDCVPEYLSCRDRAYLGAVLIELLVQSSGLFETETRWVRPKRMEKVLMPTIACLDWIEGSDQYRESLQPVYMPSLAPPAAWTDAYTGGYHSEELQSMALLKIYDKKILEEVSSELTPRLLTAIDRLQRTAWGVNDDASEVLSAFWSESTPVADLPAREDVPRPPKPAEDAGEEQLKAWKKEYFAIKGHNIATRSKRLLTSRIEGLARKFRGKALFMPHSLDFRGRSYPVPIGLQHQGNPQSRGLLRFHKAMPLKTEAAARWFKIHGANTWGEDKVSFDDRVQWVDDHHSELMAVYEDPIDCRAWEDADSPWEFLAFAMEYGEYAEQGLEFESKLPVGMDGSCNGLQVYSLLMRDRQAAIDTNCGPSKSSDAPRDLYKVVAEKASAALYASDDPVLDFWKKYLEGGPLPRSACKRPVMCRPYSITKYRAQWYLYEWFKEDKATRHGLHFQQEMGEHKSCRAMAGLVWDALNETIPRAVECMEWFKAVAVLFNKEEKDVRWTTPMGLKVVQSCWHHKPLRLRYKVRSQEFDLSYIDYSLPRRKDKRAARNGVAPNIIHSLDAACMFETVNRCAERGITDFGMIHDCFSVHAQHAPTLATELRAAYRSVFSKDLLGDLHQQFSEQLSATVPAPPARGNFDINTLLSSTYFFS